jgi:choline dehydrogenase
MTATGVVSSANEVYPAKEVILSAGTYGSAAILLRSGVGPSRDLAQLGIATIADLPVGQHLQDQPIFYNAYALSNNALQMSPAVGALLWFLQEDSQPKITASLNGDRCSLSGLSSRSSIT